MNQKILKLTLTELDIPKGRIMSLNNSEELSQETADYFADNQDQLDDSVELTILEHSASEEKKKFLERERQICIYLKGQGLEFKTDPRIKKEKHYAQKRRNQKALSAIQTQSDSGDDNNQFSNNIVDFTSPPKLFAEGNAIMKRRTPLNSPQLKGQSDMSTKKSKFFKMG